MTGLLPFSRMKGYGGQGFAASPVWALFLHKSLFPAMLQAIPSMGQRVVSTLLDRVREVTRMEQQAEKLNALGKLAGNLAHELNNPASAAQRAAGGRAARQPRKPLQAGESLPERSAGEGHRGLGAEDAEPQRRAWKT
jgi:signal transduction histidine kinase